MQLFGTSQQTKGSTKFLVQELGVMPDDIEKRIAAPMIGGILTSFLMELVIYPPIFALWKWNVEVRPKLKKNNRPRLAPEPQREMVHV